MLLDIISSTQLNVGECLFAVAGIQASQYDEQFVMLFTTTLTQLKQVRSITKHLCIIGCQ